VARGSSTAQTASTDALNNSQSYAGNASNIFGDIAPTLEAQAAHPEGMAPTDQAAANTGAEQSAGGTQSAAVGQGALLSARTRNAGGADAAIDSSARRAGQQLSTAGLQTILKNASLKQQQQQNAEGELGNLYGTSVAGGNGALNATAANVNANTSAENASWDWATDILDPMIQAGGAMGAAKLGAGGG
jgi:hypothetical protein